MISLIIKRILLTLAIETLKQLRKRYKELTPEQQEEFRQACLDVKDPMGGPEGGT
jgi:hypothetical protein